MRSAQKQALAVPPTLPQCSTVRLDVRPPRFAACIRIEGDTCRFAGNGVAFLDEVCAVFETNAFEVIAAMQAMLLLLHETHAACRGGYILRHPAAAPPA